MTFVRLVVVVIGVDDPDGIVQLQTELESETAAGDDSEEPARFVDADLDPRGDLDALTGEERKIDGRAEVIPGGLRRGPLRETDLVVAEQGRVRGDLLVCIKQLFDVSKILRIGYFFKLSDTKHGVFLHF